MSASYAYCNTNFCVLEMVIQHVTGRTLGQELQDRVFAPLRLDDTSYPPEEDLTLPDPYICGYEQTAAGWRECSHQFFGRGDGALVSTAVDLAVFFSGAAGGAAPVTRGTARPDDVGAAR